MTFDNTRRRIRSKLNLDPPSGTIGTAAGEIYVPGRPGYIYVRVKQSDGLSAPIQVRCQAVIQLVAGNPVWIGQDFDGELCILRPNVDAQNQAGYNPFSNNPAAQLSYQFIEQGRILTALCYPLDPPAMSVAVKPLKYIWNSTLYTFPGAATATISAPSAGNHQLLGVFIKTDQTLETTTSTAQDLLDDFDDTDVQELLDGATADSLPVWAWQLYAAQTTITIADSYLDLRQFINMPRSSETWLARTANNTPRIANRIAGGWADSADHVRRGYWRLTIGDAGSDARDALYAESNGTLGRVGVNNTNPTSTLDVAGDMEIGTLNAYYIGDPTTDGSWRIRDAVGSLIFEFRSGGLWTQKGSFAE